MDITRFYSVRDPKKDESKSTGTVNTNDARMHVEFPEDSMLLYRFDVDEKNIIRNLVNEELDSFPTLQDNVEVEKLARRLMIPQKKERVTESNQKIRALEEKRKVQVNLLDIQLDHILLSFPYFNIHTNAVNI